MSEIPTNSQRLYRRRFVSGSHYRSRVWGVLAKEFFSTWVPANGAILDLGCGYGDFINCIEAKRKYAMDLNPDSSSLINKDVQLFQQDCVSEWPLQSDTLDVVFTSNFLEHLPDKIALIATLRQAYRCLRPGGRVVAMGPNIKYLPGIYWDFFDHHIPLTESSLSEAFHLAAYEIEKIIERFLPYTIVNAPEYPLFFVRLYLRCPWLWRFFGRQFVVIARKPV